MTINFQQTYIPQEQVYQYEQAGDFGAALDLAHARYRESKQMDDHSDISQLEKKLLREGASRILFDENFQPRIKLIELLALVGMDTTDLGPNPIVKINQWAQENLLRREERWDQQTTKYEALKPKIRPLLVDLGFMNGSSPHFSSYNGVLFHCPLVGTVRHRLHALIEQWKKGVTFTDIYFLTGDRPLHPTMENVEALVSTESPLKIRGDWQRPDVMPQTEGEMVKMVWEQSEIPALLREQVRVHYIVAPMKIDSKTGEKTARPTTDDTCEEWLKIAPPKGRYLAVSNAPYLIRQDLVLRSIMPEGYEFETMGPPASDKLAMSIILDEVARMIFQTKQIAGKKR